MLPAAISGAQQNGKKHSNLPAIFGQARCVYIGALEGGDITRSGLYQPDRDAISDVPNGMRDWHRYSLCLTRDKADLVFLVGGVGPQPSPKERGFPEAGHLPLPRGPASSLDRRRMRQTRWAPGWK
jgi:hypothetical protein